MTISVRGRTLSTYSRKNKQAVQQTMSATINLYDRYKRNAISTQIEKSDLTILAFLFHLGFIQFFIWMWYLQCNLKIINKVWIYNA